MAAQDDPNQDPALNFANLPGQQFGTQPTGAPGQTPSFLPTPGSNPNQTVVPPGGSVPGLNTPNTAQSIITALHQQYGTVDGGRGSGFADDAYWLEHPDQVTNGRLAADWAGTGTDQPTGTPGSGSWDNSGRGGGAPAASGGGAAPAASATTGAMSPYSSSGSVFSDSNPMTGQSNDLFNNLMARANQSLDIKPNDAIIQPQVNAFNAQQQQAARNAEAQMAESAGPNANTGAETRSAQEKIGQNTSAFQATLMGQEVTARRQEIQNALSGAEGLLTAEQQMRLQEEDQQLSRAQNQHQFDENLGQQAYQFDVNDQFRNSPLAPGANG